MILTRTLRKELKIFTKNLNPSISLVLRTFINCCESANSLGFNIVEKLKVTCSCSSFYGKIFTSQACFTLNVSEYLKKDDPNDSICCYYKKISTCLRPCLDLPTISCPDRVCISKVITSKRWTVLKEPDSLAVEVIWGPADPEASEIMAVLIGVEFEIKLKDLFQKKFQRTLRFKGMVLKSCENQFFYITKYDQVWVLITDSSISQIAGGNWYSAVFNFSLSFYRPVLLFYAYCDQPAPDDMEIDDIEYMQVLIHKELGLFDPWICLCCDFENSAEVDTCSKCFEQRTNQVKSWTCECLTSNTPQSIFCSSCSKYRFKPNTAKCSNCKKTKHGKNCVNCFGFRCKFPLCNKILNFGQQMIHIKCYNECYGFCKACDVKLDSRTALCLQCYLMSEMTNKALVPKQYECFICAVCSDSFSSSEKAFCFACGQEFPSTTCTTCDEKSSKICESCHVLINLKL